MHDRAGRGRWSGLDGVLCAGLVLLSLGYFSLTLDRTLNPRDEGYLLATSDRVAAGELPHRDFMDAYGPGTFWLTALALDLGGGEVIAVRWGLAAIKALCVVLCFAVMRRSVPRTVACAGAVLSCIFWGRESVNLNAPYAAIYTLPFLLAGLLLVLRAGDVERRGAYLTAGAVAGLGVLFKQSIALTNGYALLLAIAAQSLSRGSGLAGERPGGNEGARPAPRLLAASTLAGGTLVLLPVLSYLTLRDYLLHLLPLHLLLAVLASGASRHGFALPIPIVLRDRLLPFAAGFALVVLGLLLGYLASGGVAGPATLVYDMFVLPLSIRNYALPVRLPAPVSLALLFAVLAFLAAGLFWLRGARRRAVVLLGTAVIVQAAGLLVLPNPYPRLFTPAGLWHASRMYDDLLSGLLLVAAAGLSWRWSRGSATDRASLAVVLPLAFFQAFLCFQVYPRAGANVWVVQGAFVPLAVTLLWRCHEWAVASPRRRSVPGPGGGDRLLAAAIVLALPLWFGGTLVGKVVRPLFGAGPDRRQLALPRTSGIEPTLRAIEHDGLDRIESLVAHLASTRSGEAPLLVLSNTELLYFVSGHPHLVPELQYPIFGAAHGMAPVRELERLAREETLARLQATPDAIVVTHRSPAGERLARAMPRLTEYVAQAYEVERRFGDFHLMRRR